MHPEGHGGGRAWPMVSRGTHGLDIVCEVICGLIMFVCVCAFEPSCFGKTISISMFAAAMVYSCPDLKLSIYRCVSCAFTILRGLSQHLKTRLRLLPVWVSYGFPRWYQMMAS